MGNLKIVYSLTSLFSLLLLASCGGGSTSARLEVSSSFATTGEGLDGGLLVYAESAAGKKISIALEGSTETKVTLENEKWSFYAIGWKGEPGGKMTGTAKCAAVVGQDIKTNPTVTLELADTKCASTDFTSSMNMKQLKVLSCGTFHEYDPGTDAFGPIDASTPDSYCSDLPLSFQSEYTHYRIVAMKGQNGSLSAGLTSECYPTNGSSMLKVPLSKFPFFITAYKSSQDCTNQKNVVAYAMKGGITAGNPEYFDHSLMDLGGDASRLVLPSGVSKRGNSPFLNMLPRIKCAGDDCLANMTLSAHVSAPWSGSTHRDQPLLKGVDPSVTACPTDFFKNSSYFGLKDCSVKNGTVVGSVNRNELVCQGTGATWNNLTDIYAQGDKIYIYSSSTNSIKVYSSTGEFLNTISATYSGTTMAVAPDGTIYLANGSDLYIRNSMTQIWSSAYLSGKLVRDLAVMDSGHLIVLDDNGSIYSFAPVDFDTAVSTIPYSLFADAKQIYYRNLKLYIVRVSSPPVAGDKKIFYGTANNGILGTPSTFLPSLSDYPKYVAVDNDSMYVAYSDGTSTTSMDVYSLSTKMKTASLGTALGYGTVNMTVANKNVYLQNSESTNGLQTIRYRPDVPELSFSTQVAMNECDESIPLTLGGTSKTILLKSKADSSFPVFDKAVELLGRRSYGTYLEQATYLFQGMNRNDDGYSEGGQLARVQELLSSTGISGLLPSSLISCTSVVSAITATASGSITRNQLILDPSTGQVINVSLEATKSTTVMPDYICIADDKTGPGCNDAKFDIDLNFRVVAADRTERGKLQISCSQKAGQFESGEAKLDSSPKVERELYLWNTQEELYARFEKYAYSKGANEQRGEVVVLEKDGNDFGLRSRTLRFEASASNGKTWGDVSEFEMNTTYMFTRSINLTDTSISSFFSNTDPVSQYSDNFDILRDRDNFYNSPTQDCTARVTANVFDPLHTNYLTDCNFSGYLQTTSKGFDMKIDSFSDFQSANPVLKTYFSLDN